MSGSNLLLVADQIDTISAGDEIFLGELDFRIFGSFNGGRSFYERNEFRLSGDLSLKCWRRDSEGVAYRVNMFEQRWEVMSWASKHESFDWSLFGNRKFDLDSPYLRLPLDNFPPHTEARLYVPQSYSPEESN